MSVNEKMTAIADAIRDKTGGTEALTLDGMTESIPAVFDAGKEAEQRAFWEVFQKRTSWQYAFAYNGWTDKNYNPIYPIRIGSANTNMYYDSGITNTKVSLDISGRILNYTFRDSDIVTIPELIVDESTDINQGFTNATALKNISITGTIGTNFKISWCPLSVASIKSIITALKDYTGISEYNYTLTVKKFAFETLEAEGTTAEYNGEACSWAELIDNKKWNLTLA